MQKKITAYIGLVVLLGLLFPRVTFDHVQAEQSLQQISSGTGVVELDSPSIRVVQAIPTSVAEVSKISSAPLLASACETSQSVTQELQGSAINLHEPVDCFHLQLSFPVKLPAVSVYAPSPTQTPVVVLQNAVVYALEALPFSSNKTTQTTLPVVEAVVLLLSTGLILGQKKLKIRQVSFWHALRMPLVSPLRC